MQLPLTRSRGVNGIADGSQGLPCDERESRHALTPSETIADMFPVMPSGIVERYAF